MSTPASTPVLVAEPSPGGGVVVTLGGSWEVARGGAPREAALAALAQAPAGPLTFRGEALGAWDVSLVVAVVALIESATAAGRPVDLAGLPDSLRRLLDLRRPPAAPPRPKQGHPGIVTLVGMASVDLAKDVHAGLEFTGEATLAFLRMLRGKARWRGRDFWVVMQETGAGALPIITLISFLVGLIIAFLGAVVLKRFAADYYVSYLVGYGMLREMGAIMGGIIMAGRTGAAFAAQIGSMKVSEELDALRTFGIPPMDFLVLPRLLALGVMMPLLTVYADAVGILGGFLVSMSMLDISAPQFWDGLLEAVDLGDFWLGILKGGLFGLIVAGAGCLRGLQCGSSADEVGRATTSAVVTGITLIIVTTALVDMVAAVVGV